MHNHTLDLPGYCRRVRQDETVGQGRNIQQAVEIASSGTPEIRAPLTEAALYLVLRGQSVLLIHRSDSIFPGVWVPPGGKVDPGEDPYVTAMREMKEEMGLTAIAGVQLPTISVNETQTFTLYPVLVTWWNGEPPPYTFDRHQHTTAWFPLKRMLGYVKWKDTRDVAQLIVNHLKETGG